jgi:hypothetical protein
MRNEAFGHVLARNFGSAANSVWGLSGVERREAWADKAGSVSSVDYTLGMVGTF